MCWYSADHAERVLEAEAGQRLVIRKVHGSSWAVQESDLQKTRPLPVCLMDRTKVVFRFSELEPQTSDVPVPDAEAVFRMLSRPKRDIFECADGRSLDVNNLPANLLLDVLEIPGREMPSAIIEGDHEQTDEAQPALTRPSLLERVFSLL
jgi:hypothetical protein